MKELIRLDKYLADMGIGTRSEVKKYIQKGRIRIEDVVTKDPNLKINPTNSNVYFDSQLLKYQKFVYYMLNKPVGVVSATKDNRDMTVIDLIKENNKKDIFPVGRLDKDTEGLLLITNDGELAHKLLSPKKHVPKVYYAIINGYVRENEIELFKNGIEIDKDFTTLPAELKVLEAKDTSKIELTIYEGKFHQVKRMFEAVGMKVTYLKRLSMGDLELDETLAPGDYRELTSVELEGLRGNVLTEEI